MLRFVATKLYHFRNSAFDLIFRGKKISLLIETKLFQGNNVFLPFLPQTTIENLFLQEKKSLTKNFVYKRVVYKTMPTNKPFLWVFRSPSPRAICCSGVTVCPENCYYAHVDRRLCPLLACHWLARHLPVFSSLNWFSSGTSAHLKLLFKLSSMWIKYW